VNTSASNTSPLKVLFWKECRENARWAVLALLALLLGLAYAWFHLVQQQSGPTLGQIWSGENLVLTITTPLIGLALGLLQVLPELRRDQWAFLVHRPASRTTLFFGKALAGVCLYLLATTLPLLILAAWAAQPSHVPAPFDFRFTLAGWAAILSGLPFYFAGLLVALRPARWYGSRALPLLTALLVPLAAAQSLEFLPVVLCCLLVTTILLCAAWGGFLTGGQYKEQTKPARFALGLALYPAVLGVGLGAMVLVSMSYYSAAGGFGAMGSSSDDRKIDAQGRILERKERRDGKGHATITVTDLAGRPVDPDVWQSLTRQHGLFDLAYLSGAPADDYYRYSDPDRYVQNMTTMTGPLHQTYWYYEMAARQIVGYSVTSGVPSVIGFLGPNGFKHNQKEAGRFEAARPEMEMSFGASLDLLRSPHTLYWYSTGSPATGVVQTARSQGDRIGKAVIGLTDNWGDTHAVLEVIADGRITVYRHKGVPPNPLQKSFTTPLAFKAAAPNAPPGVWIATTPDGSRLFFWYQSSTFQPNHIVTLAADGRVLKTETLTPPVTKPAVAAPLPFPRGLLGLFMPPIGMGAMSLYVTVGHALKFSDPEQWWTSWNNGRLLSLFLLFSALGGLVAAVPAWLISRRLGDGRRGQIAWALGVFLLGGYGVLLLLALRAWPARVPCPHCGRERAVDNEMCEHCGAAFARPRRDGTEIFDAEGREMEPTPLA
jgi:hypothetical protein